MQLKGFIAGAAVVSLAWLGSAAWGNFAAEMQAVSMQAVPGVHAAAVIKAYRKGQAQLADMVYSGVPAGLVGLEQRIRIGPMSGKSNVTWVLEKMGVTPTDALVQKVLEAGKSSKRLLTDAQIEALVAAGA